MKYTQEKKTFLNTFLHFLIYFTYDHYILQYICK